MMRKKNEEPPTARHSDVNARRVAAAHVFAPQEGKRMSGMNAYSNAACRSSLLKIREWS